MIHLEREPDWLAILAGGQVPCPRGDKTVGLARCLGCNWLIDLDRAADTPALRCAAVTTIHDRRDVRSNVHVD